MIHTILDNILSNPIVTGLSTTAALGAVAYQLREAPRQLWNLALHTFSVELRVRNSDPSFTWLEAWLAKQPYAKVTRRVSLTTLDKDGDEAADWVLSPGVGMHRFWWRNRFVIIDRNMDEPNTTAQSGKRGETLTFRTIGRSQDVLRALVYEAKAATVENESIHIRVWRSHWWSPVRGKQPRDLSTIILQDGQIDRIVADMDWYLGAKDWYFSRGLPYRRGYLFDGPPGTGKTSMVLALAGHFKRPVCVLNIGSLDDDEALFAAIHDAPVNAFVVIEDIDCATSAGARATRATTPNKSDDQDESRGVTKAGLLNALDGITTPDGRIFIMTTNHPESLDPALIRPGRADVRETFSYLGPIGQARLAACFYADGFEPLENTPLSPALMQATFMRFPEDPAMARRALIAETA